MDKLFANVQHHVGDVYVADYTQFTSEHPDQVNRGVVVSDIKPALIGSLMFRNPNGVRVLSVNFEKNQGLFKASGKMVQNCECMLVSEQGNQKRWLALAELKYCKGEDRNIGLNFENALGQLCDTFLYLRDTVGLFDENQYKYYIDKFISFLHQLLPTAVVHGAFITEMIPYFEHPAARVQTNYHF